VKDFKITDDDKEIDKYAELIRNVGVAKSMLAEVTDKTNQKEAFSLPGLCWSFGLLDTANGVAQTLFALAHAIGPAIH
ncbi:9943_t:CDS:2, partial [Racocetra persica]